MGSDPENSDEQIECYVALGSNLGDSDAILHRALDTLASHTNIDALEISPFYQSKPHGPHDQPDYINAVARFVTSLEAEELLNELQRIENDNGRQRANVERWGARTLDLDLLLYGDQTIETERLSVPHPRMCERVFVLYPLQDLQSDSDNDLIISKETTLQECIDNLPEVEKSSIKEI